MPDFKDVIALLFAWVLTAGVGAAVALVATPAARDAVPLPPQRRRATAWTGPLVGAAFLAFFFLPSLVLPYVNRTSVARWLYGTDVDAAAAQVVVSCAADLVTLPFLVAAWAGLATQAGKPPVLVCDRRRAAAGYLAAYRVWLYLTPVVYAVDFITLVGYGLVVGHRPEDHAIVQAMKTEAVSVRVVTLLALQALLVAPVKEELFFRGIVQPWLAARPWGGDVGVGLAAVAGVLFQKPVAVSLADPWSILTAAAPVLFVFAVLPLYQLIERWDLERVIPLRDAAARRHAARGIFGTALLFANFHARFWPTPIPLFVLALGLGWLAFRRQGVGASIALHVLFNAIVFAEMALGAGLG